MRESIKKIRLIDPEFNEANLKNLSFLLAGDFNSQPVSSAMSVFHDETITENDDNSWQIPMFTNIKQRDFYLNSNDIFEKWKSKGRFEPLIGRINSAYNLYNQPDHSQIHQELSFDGLKKSISS